MFKFFTLISFRKFSPNDLAQFRKLLPNSNQILHSPFNDLSKYNRDWLNKIRGKSELVLKPKCTTELSEIMKICDGNKFPVSIFGGNTGLVGGSIGLTKKEITISLELMNEIHSVDCTSQLVKVDSGVVLETLNIHLSEYDLMIPWDLGAKGSCQLGGNVSTNAGGVRFVKFKSLRNFIIGLQVVTSKGEILDLNYTKTLYKDNTGYDLKQGFIGSEGTLGIISKICIQCVPKLENLTAILIPVKRSEEIAKIIKICKLKFGENLSAFEFFDENCLRILKDSNFEIYKTSVEIISKQDNFPFFLIIEICNLSHDKILEIFMENSENLISENGIISTNISQYDSIWKIREYITPCISEYSQFSNNFLIKFDVSFSNLNKLFKFLEFIKMELKVKFPQIVNSLGYGHIVDCNLHLNLLIEDDSQLNQIENFIYENVDSVSAEHGIGLFKRDQIYRNKCETSLNYMRKMKKIWDPSGILNPGKLLTPR